MKKLISATALLFAVSVIGCTKKAEESSAPPTMPPAEAVAPVEQAAPPAEGAPAEAAPPAEGAPAEQPK